MKMTKLDLLKEYLSNHGFIFLDKIDYDGGHDYRVRLKVVFYNVGNTIHKLRNFNIYQVQFHESKNDEIMLIQTDYTHEYD